MKVTHFSRAGFPLALGGWSTGTISVNSNFNTTDGGFSALNFVQGITANGSNMLLRPIANIAAGSNVILTLDSGPGGSIPSNTIRIHSTGGATGPAGPTGPSGALVFLEAHTASSSATLDFTSFISSTYDDYQIEVVGILPATDGADLEVEVGTGGGPTYDTTGANYSSQVWGVKNDATILGPVAQNPGIPIIGYHLSNTVDYGGAQITLRLRLPQSTTQRRNMAGTFTYVVSSGGLSVATGTTGVQYQTLGTALTALRFLMSTGNIASGLIRIYGISKS